jgi:hypothetical protein
MGPLTASYRRDSFCGFQTNVAPVLSAVSTSRENDARRSGNIGAGSGTTSVTAKIFH